MYKTQIVVIGAGVVGLACARALARSGFEVIILEKNKAFGAETSSRNSGVIHAGIYYRPGSDKALLCARGKELLYPFCNEYGVPNLNCGKLIVATSSNQISYLKKIQNQAKANGVDDLNLLSKNELLSIEPELSAACGLLSPSTGIIDSHAFMLALLGDAERHGAILARCSEVTDAFVTPQGLALKVNNESQFSLLARHVVNSAGLHATSVASLIDGISKESVPESWYAKGSYFSLSGKAPFSRLIYPVPESGGLGIHLTLDLAGQAMFGPDVEWVHSVDYDVNPSKEGEFYNAIRTYWPGLKDGTLHPAYSGIRPKIVGPGKPDADFGIQYEKSHRVRGLVNLYGIESPGLTASLAIAESVALSIATMGLA
jgi:D-amino-acid oxidase